MVTEELPGVIPRALVAYNGELGIYSVLCHYTLCHAIIVAIMQYNRVMAHM